MIANREVGHVEFLEYVAAYPMPLTTDVKRFYDPPVLVYHHFPNGAAVAPDDYDATVVAWVVLDDDLDQRTYHIAEDRP